MSAIAICHSISYPFIFPLTLSLTGCLLVLLVCCIYHQPDFRTGSYIKFTQTLFSSRVYKILANCTSVVSVTAIAVGIYILIKEGKNWTDFIVSFLLALIASRSLLVNKSNGLNLDSEKFSALRISRGNALMSVLNFFLTTNTAVLDEIEVQIMKKGLPDDVAAADIHEQGFLAYFDWSPLSDEDINLFLTSNDDNSSGEMKERPTILCQINCATSSNSISPYP